MANEFYRFYSNRGANFDGVTKELCDTATNRTGDVELCVKEASAMKTDEILAALDRIKAAVLTTDPKHA